MTHDFSMTAKEDLVESQLTNGQQPSPPPAADPVEVPDEQQAPPPDYQTSIQNENDEEEIDDDNVLDENGQPIFPTDDLAKLEEQVNRIRWTIPVLSDGELIKCLRAAVRLARKKLDTKSEPCQRFIRDSMVTSFTKIFCDDAVQSWKIDIHRCIYKNAMVFVRLCVFKLDDDCFPLLDVLSFVMNPNGRFHQANQSQIPYYHSRNEAEPFAMMKDYRFPQRGWLLDLINKFGDLGGFDRVLARLTASETKLTVALVIALLKPWGLCYEYLTQSTIKKYFAPIIEFVPQFLDQLTETDLKGETKGESKSDTLSAVIKWLRHLASRLIENEKACRNLDTLQLKIILRLLETNSFSGKMNALNEVNKLLPNLNSIHRAHDSDGLTAEKFLAWVQEHQILDIVLRDCLHQPQYVEKLERLLRFIIKEQALTQQDLAKIWNASCGKHEAIEKNVHDLLAKVAWDFSPEQLEQLFDCFRESWTKASKKQREKLLELIRRLAEEDREGLMANKVLQLLWNISFDKHLPNEIIDQALAAHLKILECSYFLEKEKTKLSWINLIMDEIKRDQHVIISLKQIREICTQFSDHAPIHHMSRISGPLNRMGVISLLEDQHKISHVITESLCHYMDDTRRNHEETKKILPPYDYYPDGRFNHSQQIHERLFSLKFILKEGRLYLNADHLKMIWTSLAEHAIYPEDREQCFRWFAETIDQVGFEAKTTRDFFQHQIMKLEPHLLTDMGMTCFDRFFKCVNAQSHKFQQKRHSIRLLNDEDLIGIEYLWKLITNGSEEVATRAIQLMKEIYTNISPQLKHDARRIHQAFLQDCFQRLKSAVDAMKAKSNAIKHQNRINALVSLLTVLKEYLAECDASYHKDRVNLPMFRAFRGRPVVVVIRINTGQNRQTEDLEHFCHSNETWGQIRRLITHRYRTTYGVLELYRNSELIHPFCDNRTLGQLDGRDRITIVGRWIQQPIQVGSSGESDSDESEMNNNISSHHSHPLDSTDINAENALPSVIFSQKHEYYQYLIEIADLACKEKNSRLRDVCRQILDSLPVDPQVKSNFVTCLISTQKGTADEHYTRLKPFYLLPSSTQMLYNFKTTLIQLAPAIHPAESNEIESFHVFFLNAGGLTCLLDILTHKKYTESCDMTTKKSIYWILFSILKRFLTILGFYHLRTNNPNIHQESLDRILTALTSSMISTDPHATATLEKHVSLLLHKHHNDFPIPKSSFIQYDHLLEMIRLIWCLASNNKQMSYEVNMKKDFLQIHKTFKQENVDLDEANDYEDDDGASACREGLEIFSIAMILVPSSVDLLLKEKFLEYFFLDLILYCHYPILRHTANEQLFFLTAYCSPGQTMQLLTYLIDKQFQILNQHSNDLQKYSIYSSDFFVLLCRLLAFAFNNRVNPANIEQQLNDEIQWLKHIPMPINDYLLRGHLNLAKELLQFQDGDHKRRYGIDQGLIERIIEQFLFPASTALYQYRLIKQQQSEDVELNEPSASICQTAMTTSAAFELLVTLGTNCLENLKLIDQYMTNLFYSAPDSSLNEWDFSLPFGSRPNQGFVGLKNAAATCYMNSVLQQMFMIRPLRTALLSVKIPPEYCTNEVDEDDLRRDNFDAFSDAKSFLKDNNSSTVSPPKETTTDRKEYNIQILRQIQRMFGHLLDSRLQYYIPKEFWKIFKFSGEPINLRDQQDAVEFLNNLVDSVDEALKALNLPQICANVLGGVFADQKICKDCPHRYTREEDFTLLSVDIRHSQNLQGSLEQYVQGELLDGPNAYFCEKCDKKVDTVKRACFKKLPSILAIQLKRFDYDWERETPIKFNDYFEFPRELDMEPYTVQGLAKAEGSSATEETTAENDGTRYKLVGIIVHKGQANGGHYYSFIQQKDETEPMNHGNWYLFDDTDVSESKMDDDDELRSQCFGGDQPTSSFDQPMMKRQRRWWNAYILFYEKIPLDPSNPINHLEKKLSELQLYDSNQRMPLSVQRSVRKQNIKFLHNRILFSQECFTFIKRLVQSNVQQLNNLLLQQQQQQQQRIEDQVLFTNTVEELALICVQIATKFLFSIGWRTKKLLRGAANEWTELLSHCIRSSRQARIYLANEVLFKHPSRFQEYLIDCPSADIRNAFSRILFFLATSSNPQDVDHPTEETVIEETILNNLLRLIKKDVPDSFKQLTQYFQFFILYAGNGRPRCEQLIRMDVPRIFANLAVDDLSSSSLPRLNEPSKLFTILSTLIRCFDVSSLCKSHEVDQDILPNPYYTSENRPICPIPNELIEIIYKREQFLKKILEDSSSCGDSLQLLRFLLWENVDITSIIFNEIAGLLSSYYSYELRAHLELIYAVLMIEDSWQEARLLYALKGIPIREESSKHDRPSPITTISNNNNNEGHQSLFDILAKSKSANHKRAYQFLKMFLLLFTNCPKANHLLQTDPDIKNQWIESVRWLHIQLEKPTNIPSNYNYYPSQGQITSNETSQGYYLERTNSAKSVLEKANELCSEKDNDHEEMNIDEKEEEEESIDQSIHHIPPRP